MSSFFFLKKYTIKVSPGYLFNNFAIRKYIELIYQCEIKCILNQTYRGTLENIKTTKTSITLKRKR